MLQKRSPLISCIIPVYNKEKYLKRALDSALNQTLSNFEIISIDDASTDNSLNILREFEAKDERVIVLEQNENVGAAVSRNRGLKMASGKYVIFLDADDFFYPDMLRKAYTLIDDNEAEIVLFSYCEKRMNAEGKFIRSAKSVFPNKQIQTPEDFASVLFKINSAPWNKLVDIRLLKEREIEFQSLPNCNDVFWSLAVLFSAKKIVVSDAVLVEYYIGQKGCLSNRREKQKHYIIEAFDKVLDFLLKNHFSEEIIFMYIRYVLYQYLAIITSENYTEEVKEDIGNCFRNSNLLKYINGMVETNDGFYDIEKALLKNIESGKVKTIYGYFSDAVGDIMKKAKINKRKVALWGCGIRGKKLLDELDKQERQIDYVIDMSETVRKETYKGYRIYSYAQVKDAVDIIVITNSGLMSEICQNAEGKLVIDLYTYCSFDFKN